MSLEILNNKEPESIKVGDYITQEGWDLWYKVTRIEGEYLWLLCNENNVEYKYMLSDEAWKIRKQ